MKYQVGILDNDIYQLEILNADITNLISENHLPLECYFFTTSYQLAHAFKSRRFDMLLLDIELEESENGIELAQQYKKLYPSLIIIFITCHKQYAFDAFNIDADGYITKPIAAKRMMHTLCKSIKQMDLQKKAEIPDTLTITHENIKKTIKQKNIIYIERRSNKTMIVTARQTFIVYESLIGLLSRLHPIFIRVQQGAIVNIAFVTAILDNELYLSNNASFKIGRTYKKKVLEIFNA